jgi:hypothetical protein
VKLKKNLLKVSIISSLLIVFLQFFQWKLIEVLTVFLMPFLWLGIYGLFLVVFILSIVGLIKRKDWKPFVIQSITILLLFLIPFNKIVLDIDFKLNQSERSEVISKIQDGTLIPNVSHNSSLIHLPKEYDQLSSGGGDIVIEKRGDKYAVLFFTFRGVLDNFSGFVFSPYDTRPLPRSFGGDFKDIVRIDKNWYFVGSY